VTGATSLTVSIVTPSYNQGRFIAETIESAMGQEGEFELEHIVIDGASTDGTVEILKRYEERVRGGEWADRCRGVRFRWVSEPDRGQSDAIGKGFRMAGGQICSWLNSDDTLLPGALGKVLETFRRNPEAGLVYGKVYFTDASGEIVSEVETGPTDYEGLAALNLLCQPGVFFRRAAWDAVGGLDENLHYAMDHDLWIRMACRFPLVYLPEPMATYRLHGKSKTGAARHAVAFQEETLRVIQAHFGRAPLNRVYGYSVRKIQEVFPAGWSEVNPLVVATSVLFALWEYLRRNRGVRLEDLRMIRPCTLRKMFREGVQSRGGSQS
jgi:glycosyltransferase involved in cell wall biosynthesis